MLRHPLLSDVAVFVSFTPVIMGLLICGGHPWNPSEERECGGWTAIQLEREQVRLILWQG